MFPSLDINGNDLFDPFVDTHQAAMLPSFCTNIQSPSSQHHNSSSSFPFSADLLDNIDESCLISQFFLPKQDAAANFVESPRNVYKKNNEMFIDGTTSEHVPRRRTNKKRVRHSKICTAQGPRDRRMRLSLQIARKFFGLQDMLGFDKASKTIEWLFSKSKSSIKQLKENVAASGGDAYEHLKVNEKAKDETLKVSKVSKKRGQTTVESSCKTKESREKARKRARERTLTKMKIRLSGLIDTSKTIPDFCQVTRNVKITSGAQVEGENQEQKRSNNHVNMVEYQMDSVSIIEKFLGLTSTNYSSSSSIFGDSEESYASLSSRGKVITPREHNTSTSTASVDEERNPISSFSLYDYFSY